MEPSDLKPTPPDDAAFEAWLRANAALPPLPAAEFSAQVLATVPPRRISRGLFVTLGLVAGVAIAVTGAAVSGDAASLPVLDAKLTEALTGLLSLPVAGALALTALSLGYAFRDRLRLLPRL